MYYSVRKCKDLLVICMNTQTMFTFPGRMVWRSLGRFGGEQVQAFLWAMLIGLCFDTGGGIKSLHPQAHASR